MNANIIIKKASDGTTRINAHVGEGSKRCFMLMEHDYLTLKFATDTPEHLQLGDYVEVENVGRYELTAPTRGELNKATGAYDYEIRLDAQYWKFKNKLCKFLPQIGGRETSWTFTDTIASHAQQIIGNMRAQAYSRDLELNEQLIPGREGFLYMGLKGGSGDWCAEIGDSVDKVKAITIQYDSTNIIDAISQIAEAYECEWWFEQNVLHFGKCEYGTTPVKLEMGQELVAISRNNSQETYATRIYAFGSNRNIASNYRKELVFDASLKNGKLLDLERQIQLGYFHKDGIGKTTADPSAGFTFDLQGASRTGDNELVSYAGYDDNGREYCAAYGYLIPELKFRYDAASEFATSEKKLFKKTIATVSASGFKAWVKPKAIRPVNVHSLQFGDEVEATITILYTEAENKERAAFESIEIKAKAKLNPIGEVTEISFEDFEVELEKDVAHVCLGYAEFRIKCKTSERTQWSQYGKFDYEAGCSGHLALSSHPEWKAEGITIEVLDKQTGEIAETIEDAIFNEAYESENRKLTLPAGKTIAPGAKYRLPQLNKAVVPARLFSSIYATFEKYADIATNGITNDRLMLPEQDEQGNPLKGYLDAFDFESEEQAVEDVVIFEDIYPSRKNKIASIQRSDEYTIDQEEQDGSTTRKTYREYIYTDDLFTEANPFNRDYIIDTADLKVTFQSGQLNGMTFNVELLEDNVHFQIKRDDTTGLPNEIIKPQEGDEFILAGFNIAMLSDSKVDYNRIAEAQLLAKAREYIAKLNTDTSTYQCTIACDVAYEVEAGAPDGLYLGIGRIVNLIHPGYFSNGRISRVLGYEIPLDFAYDNPVYFIGEKASYSRIGAIEDKLSGLANASANIGGVFGGAGGGEATNAGGKPYIIEQIDSTPPTDKNVYSALRARLEFALKTAAQRIKHLWEFMAGIKIGTFIAGQSGAQIDSAGNAEVESLKVRSYMRVQELIYNRLNAQEGDTSFSDIGTIERIITNDDGTQTAQMRLRWDGDLTAFQQGDIVYGYVNNLGNTTTAEKYKTWAWVKEVNRAANQLTLVRYPDSEVPAGVNYPMTEGMTITRWGNCIEPSLQTYLNPDYRNAGIITKVGENEYRNTRQNSFFISCEGGHICELTGVNKPVLEPGNYGTILGKIPEGLLDEKTAELINKDQPYLFARGIIVQDLIRVGYEGITTRSSNYRGVWDAATASSATLYYRSTKEVYDTVTWKGALWQCVATKTTDEPSAASGAWLQMTTSREDQTIRIWQIVPNASIISVRKNEVRPETLSAIVRLNTSSENNTLTFDNNYDLLQAGAQLYYSLDGLEVREFQMGTAEPLELEDGTGYIETEDGGDFLVVGGDDISTDEIGDRVIFYLKDASTGAVLDQTHVPVVKDGTDGSTGDFTSYAFKQSASNPGAPSDSEHIIPTGWQDAPTGDGKWWMTKATISGATQKPTTAWSEPVQCTGEDGAPGQYTDFMYKAIRTGMFILWSDPKARKPLGWQDTPPQLSPGYDLYMIQAHIDHNDNLVGEWSAPARISGEKGEKGEQGEQGRDGLMVYPAGNYDQGTEYTATSETAPVVMYADNFYVLKRGKTYKGADQLESLNTPALDIANNSQLDARWQRFDKFDAIFADIIMADFAKLSSAVFCGDWMISQQGVRNGAESTEYQHFKDGTFEPNFAVNFKTGEMSAASGVFSGSLFTKLKTLEDSDAELTNEGYTLNRDLKIISSGADRISLPSDISLIGQRVLICNNVTHYSREDKITYIATQAGSYILGYPSGETSAPTSGKNERNRCGILTGSIELVAIPKDISIDNQDKCDWMILSLNARFSE